MVSQRLALCAVFLLWASHAWAITFTMPVQCQYGRDCFIQNYVEEADHKDYRCGTLTYPGHKGTDFRVTDFTAMKRGVPVLAAADGRVLRLRNSAPDTGLDAGRGAVGNQECGNGLVIAHAEGFETQYCHMKQGSVLVRAGEVVKAGDIIGQVGYSGLTEFPHLHITVTQRGAVVDPFNAATPAASARCNANLTSLWNQKLSYIDTAVLSAGISTAIPKRDAVSAPLVPLKTAPASSPLLVLWVQVMGIQAGDVLAMELIAPDGTSIARQAQPAERTQAFHFKFIGKKFHAPLASGSYVGKVGIERGGVPLPNASASTSIQVP